ncbi:hypothetical protein LUZ60_004998 [Juncus effusus]|nr:hypothetical protein LUZ60_004998 [Juncus effusus]
MDLSPFKLDIDELLNNFTQGNFTSFADFKRIWKEKKFSYIFASKPSKNSAFFMQSLYTHCIGHMDLMEHLSHKFGALYCLYCLYEIQPFKPSFKIYLSLGDLTKLKDLVIEAKKNNVKTVPSLVKKMLNKNIFLFGFVDMINWPARQKLDEITKQQNRRVEIAYENLLTNSKIERYLHMDLGVDLELENLKKMSSDYARAKEMAIQEASQSMETEDLKNIITENKTTDKIEEICGKWEGQKAKFYERTGISRPNQLITVNDDFDELEQLLND